MAAGAAAAAAAQQRKIRREEEEMTAYSNEDVSNWEFKIIRSATHQFRDPAFMAQSLAQEARFGWVLVEKFDNERLRLKRPLSARAGDAALAPADAYRSVYGMGEGALGLSVALGVMLFMGIGIAIIVALT